MKRNKSVTNNSRKKKKQKGHEIVSLKLQKSTSYSPTAKDTNTTQQETPTTISLNSPIYHNIDNKHLESENKMLNDQILKLECDNRQLKDENDILRNDFTIMKKNNDKLQLKVDLLNEQVLSLTKKQVILNEKLKIQHRDTINWIMALDESDVKKYKAIMEYKHKLIKHGNKNNNPNNNKVNTNDINNINNNNNDLKMDMKSDMKSDNNSSVNTEFNLDRCDSKTDTDMDNHIHNADLLGVDESLLKVNPDSYSSTNTIIDNNNDNNNDSSNFNTNIVTNTITNDNTSTTISTTKTTTKTIQEPKKKHGPPKFWDIPDLSKSKRERAAIGSCISKR